MQNESFLEYQRQLNSRCGRDNAQSLFGLVNIPTIEQIKNILDRIAKASFFTVQMDLSRSERTRLFEAVYSLGWQLTRRPRWDSVL